MSYSFYLLELLSALLLEILLSLQLYTHLAMSLHFLRTSIFIPSTGFLIGFGRQFRNMVDNERRITSALFIGALLGTLFSALVLESKIAVILCLVVQIPSYIWYCATYIPFARDCIKSCLRGCLNKLKK